MYIHSVEVKPLSFPLEKPITTNLHTLKKIDGLYIIVHANSGLSGCGFIYGFGKIPYQEIMWHIRNNLAPLLNKVCISQTLMEWKHFWAANRIGKPASWICALAAIDIAIWDIFSKQKCMSLHKILSDGIDSKEIPVYATTGWLSLTNDELVSECKKYMGSGINAFKVRLGHEDDYVRIKLLREAMGEDFLLMVDANQRYSVSEAIEVANRLARFNLVWFEEPVGNSVLELMQVADSIQIPIAVGENMTRDVDFMGVCKNRSANFLQPDIMKCGGITGFLSAAQIVKQHNLKLCSHLLQELSVSLIGSYQNGYMLEYGDLLPNDIFTQDFSVRNGYMRLPIISGTGVELTEDTLKEFSICSSY